MKVRGSLRRLCAHCKIVRRGKKTFVICSETPRHKQRQGFCTLVLPEDALPQLAFQRNPAFLGPQGGCSCSGCGAAGAAAASPAAAAECEAGAELR